VLLAELQQRLAQAEAEASRSVQRAEALAQEVAETNKRYESLRGQVENALRGELHARWKKA
jgi:hypothetical protein